MLNKQSIKNIIYNEKHTHITHGTFVKNRHDNVPLQALYSLNNGVVPWVSQVRKEVIDRTLAGEVMLNQKSEKSQHGKPACARRQSNQFSAKS